MFGENLYLVKGGGHLINQMLTGYRRTGRVI